MPKLANNEGKTYTDVFKADFVKLQQIGNGGTLQIATIPAGGALLLAGAIKTAVFTGTTSTVINVGTTLADPDEYIDALNISTSTTNLPVFNTGDTMVQAAGNSTFLGGSKPVTPVSVDTPVYIKVTDAAIASATAGELLIGLVILDLLQYRN